jgi:hypothetical protein
MKKKYLYFLGVIFLIIVLILIAGAFRPPESVHLRSEEVPDNPASKICQKISQPVDIYYCLAVVNRDPTFCQKIDQPEGKDVCLAMIGEDIDYCRKITDPLAKKSCYYELSIVAGRIDYCDELEDQIDCYFALIHRWHWRGQSEKIQAAYCEKLADGSSRGELFANLCWAFKDQDPNLCQGDGYCLSYFPQPESFCENAAFKAPDGKTFDEGDCWGHQAMSKKDASLCDKVTDPEVRDICYGSFSTHISPDISLCEKITDEMRQNMCYTEYAINLSQE